MITSTLWTKVTKRTHLEHQQDIFCIPMLDKKWILREPFLIMSRVIRKRWMSDKETSCALNKKKPNSTGVQKDAPQAAPGSRDTNLTKAISIIGILGGVSQDIPIDRATAPMQSEARTTHRKEVYRLRLVNSAIVIYTSNKYRGN